MIEFELVEQDHLLTIEQNREVIACCDYSWVLTYDDILKADRGEPYHEGPVLYVANIINRLGGLGTLLKLRSKLPKARWIVGLTEDWKLKAPKGVPAWFGSSSG